MKNLLRLVFVATLFGLFAQSKAAETETNQFVVLNDRAWSHIDEALHLLNCTRFDAGFNKDVVTNLLWTFEPVRELLNHPFDIDPMAEQLLDWFQNDPQLVPAYLGSIQQNESTQIEEPRQATLPRSARIHDDLRHALEVFRGSHALTVIQAPDIDPSGLSSLLFSQFDTVSFEEQLRLMEPFGLGDDATQQMHRSLLDPKPATESQLAAGIQAGSLADLSSAGELLSQQIDRLIEACSTMTNWPAAPQEVSPGWWIGTLANDHYSEAMSFVLDPGGDDHYSGLAGSAHPGNPLAITIDLAGNDVYRSDELLGAGAALGGTAILIDVAGDDLYRATHMGQGACIAGYARHNDLAGNDVYEAGNIGQGAAIHGVAILEDFSGRDHYLLGQCGQAFAGVRGIASLIDHAGNDSYLAYGLSKVPWYPKQKFTMAQGFAIGDRPFVGGGVAALIDLAGNDVYKADVYGQGVSYWYSLGMLYDRSGNDTYTMFHYGQGSGIHLSVGLLVDGSGKDTYTAAEGLAQGNAHDYAIGWLIDQGTDPDQYSADHFSQGRGMNNSFAMLIDEGGRDSYYARDTSRSQGIGDDGRYREYGSLSLMLDFQGSDNYSIELENGTFVRRPNHGIVYDWPEPPPEPKPEPKPEEKK